MKPLIPLTDHAFKYTPAVQTDIRKRFAKVRRELQARADAEAKEIAAREADSAKVIAVFDKRRKA